MISAKSSLVAAAALVLSAAACGSTDLTAHDADPSSEHTGEAAQADTAPPRYWIVVESLTPLAMPDAAPNEYHVFATAAAYDPNAPGGPALRTTTPADDVFAADAVNDTTYDANDRGRVGRFVIGPIDLSTSADAKMRIVLLGDDNSGNSTLDWQDGERPPPPFASTHPFFTRQAAGFALQIAPPTAPPPLSLDVSSIMLAGGNERTCSGPFLADSFDYDGQELLRRTQNPSFSFDETRTQRWSGVFDDDHEDGSCLGRASTRYTIRVTRDVPSFGTVPTCTARDLVPADTTDAAAWVGTWGDNVLTSSSRASAHIWRDAGPPWLDVATHETVRLATTSYVDASFTGEVPFRVNEPDYVGDRFPSWFSLGPGLGGPPRMGSHPILMSNPSVQLEAYVGRCAENGQPTRRMRYMRRSNQGTLITDVMMQPAHDPPH